MIGYPKWFSKKLIHSVFALLFITGAFLFPTVLVLKLEFNFPWRLATEQRDWVVIGHVVMGFVVFTVLGALSSIHMRVGFRKKSKRTTGVALILFLLLLAGTGIGILYTGDEKLSTLTSIVHFSLGSLMALAYVAHLIQKPRSVNKQTRYP